VTDQIRTAVITGAARGIGAAIARRLGNDGFAVAVLDLDETACKPVMDEINASGGKALAVGVDVADEQAAATTRRLGVPLEDFKAAAAKQIPVARVGQPEDIAATVSFLAREDASFASGQVIYVAGGPRA
jgi:NAD(P)-dependent dehydrogenase (short-subunit alcohol dehydrogenase family)